MATEFAAVPVTAGAHHYFGYYDLQPWNGSGTHLLVHRPPFADRIPGPDDFCEIGVVEVATGTYEPVARTCAWNFQQGCLLHWHPRWPDDVILFNDRIGDRFVAVELNLRSGTRRVLPRPISAVDTQGKRALSLNFSRLAELRPGYGYSRLTDPFSGDLCPADDGVYIMDLESGDHQLVLSHADLAAEVSDPRARRAHFWLNHTIFSDDGQRFAVISGYSIPILTRRLRRSFVRMATLQTLDVDGANRRTVLGPGVVSHYDWLGSNAILAFATHAGETKPRYWLVSDIGEPAQPIASDRWTCDGHCSYSPDRRWIVTDTYPSKNGTTQHLMLHDTATGAFHELGSFESALVYRGPLRCDLHPRFSRDGRMICFDSTHSGMRQMYLMDVAELTAPSGEA